MRTAGKWLEERYLDWQMEQGSRRTITEFAELLGTSQSYVSRVMQDKYKPSEEMAAYWAYILDNYEIFDIMDIEPNSYRMQEIRAVYDSSSPDQQENFYKVFQEWAEDHGFKRTK